MIWQNNFKNTIAGVLNPAPEDPLCLLPFIPTNECCPNLFQLLIQPHAFDCIKEQIIINSCYLGNTHSILCANLQP